MVSVSNFNPNRNISVQATDTSSNVIISSEINSNRSVVSNINEENVIDIGNLFAAGTGITISFRTISADSSVVAFKSDLNNFLTSSDISNKADKATTLSGYGILDGITYEEVIDEEDE